MIASERIKYIKELTKELAKEEWPLIDITLRQFGQPRTDYDWSTDKESCIAYKLNDANDADLLNLAKHLGFASQLETASEPTFWDENAAKIFLSHLAANKVGATQLQEHLKPYAISAFVAHVDIEPTQDWQKEIESALASMDALVALLTPGFKESNWCDQEVGVAIGRNLPIISVRQGLDPYGFIGKYQAVQGAGKTPAKLADELFKLLIVNPVVGSKITDALVQRLSNSTSFASSKTLIKYVKQSKFVDSSHISVLLEAVKGNSQVGNAISVPEQIDALAKRLVN